MGGRVTVRATAGEPLTVAVFNSGSFIPAEELTRIFERFYWLDRARSGPQRGSGLGLSIARELAELHGGALTAESNPQGTTFHLRLPAARSELRLPRPDHTPASPARQPS